MNDLAAALGLEPESLPVADVGAAFFGEKALYQPLLDEGVARLFAFEPEEAQHAALREVLPASAMLLPYALGDGDRHALHVGAPGMTSLLEPDPAAYAYFTLLGGKTFAAEQQAGRKIPVDTRRLDDVAELERLDFIKLDIQGAELMVLQNGRTKLAECSVVQIETPFLRLYKNQPTYGEIEAELLAQGFMVHGFASLNRLSVAPWGASARGNQVIDLDMIFIRDFVHLNRLSDRTLSVTAIIADRCYGSFDLALRALLALERRGRLEPGGARRYFDDRRQAQRRVIQHAFPAPPK